MVADDPDLHTQSIGFSFDDIEPDLFADGYLPADIGKLIRAGFSGGFLRNSDPAHTSLFDVPAKFCLSRALLPRVGLDLKLPLNPENSIDREFVARAAHEMRAPWRSGLRGLERSGNEHMTAFLSTSFSPIVRQQRVDLKKELLKVGIECVDAEDVSHDQFLFSAIVKNIRDCDFTILDVTILRPYTMFEVGLCAGGRRPKSVICVVNDSDGNDRISDLHPFLHKLPILQFSFSAKTLSRTAAQIRSRINELRSKPSEFSKVLLTSTSLRPRKRTNTVFVSLPNASWRESAVDAVRSLLEQEGWTLVVEEDADSYSANEFQVPISCAYMTRIGVIDTTGADGVDLLQCYKLGLFAGKRRPWRVLQTERLDHSRPTTFASVPGMPYHTWSTYNELSCIVRDFVIEDRNSKARG